MQPLNQFICHGSIRGVNDAVARDVVAHVYLGGLENRPNNVHARILAQILHIVEFGYYAGDVALAVAIVIFVGGGIGLVDSGFSPPGRPDLVVGCAGVLGVHWDWGWHNGDRSGSLRLRIE